jgi:hypothetical protein
MKRYHLFEIHDQPWFPDILRNEITLILELLWTLDLPLPFYTAPYRSVLDILNKKLDKNTKSAVPWRAGHYNPKYLHHNE